MNLSILIIDDHPTQIDGYKSILKYNDAGYEILFDTALNAEKAYKTITNPAKKEAYNIVVIDWSLPPFEEAGVQNGEDLAKLVRKHMPKAKIMVLTSHSEGFLMTGIEKSVNPEALMVKSDFTAHDLLHAFETVVSGGRYRTETVKSNTHRLKDSTEFLDSCNRKIIILLSQGVKTKSLPEQLNLSQSAVEKRKAFIKEYLGIKGNDEDIVKEAKRLGYI